MSQFTDPLLVTPLPDGKSWVIVSDFSFYVGEEEDNNIIHVAKGFVTDFASVPRMLWWALPKWGVYGKAAVLHDWLYWEQSQTRTQADDIMLEAMNVLNVSIIKKRLIYRAVRTFGRFAWKNNKQKKERGENRVNHIASTTFSVSITNPDEFMHHLDNMQA